MSCSSLCSECWSGTGISAAFIESPVHLDSVPWLRDAAVAHASRCLLSKSWIGQELLLCRYRTFVFILALMADAMLTTAGGSAVQQEHPLRSPIQGLRHRQDAKIAAGCPRRSVQRKRRWCPREAAFHWWGSRLPTVVVTIRCQQSIHAGTLLIPVDLSCISKQSS